MFPADRNKDFVEHLRTTLPMLSDEVIGTLTDPTQYGLTPKDASTLLVLDDGGRLDYYFDVVHKLQAMFINEPQHLSRIGKVSGNW